MAVPTALAAALPRPYVERAAAARPPPCHARAAMLLSSPCTAAAVGSQRVSRLPRWRSAAKALARSAAAGQLPASAHNRRTASARRRHGCAAGEGDGPITAALRENGLLRARLSAASLLFSFSLAS